jgi:lysozyme family protein
MLDRSLVLKRWQECKLVKAGAEAEAKRAMTYQTRFQGVSDKLGAKAPPWWFIASLMMRESGITPHAFETYLGNGDSIHHKSIHVPAGRGPFANWEAGAMDALTFDHMNAPRAPADHWDVVTCLIQAEMYNGMGYANKGRISPYVWSFTNIYQGGKYIRDGVYSGSTWDSQCGVAAMWIALRDNHGISLNEA